MSLVVGIDPGLSGALAVLDADGSVECVHDLPIIRDRSLAWIDRGELQSLIVSALQGRTAHAIVERVSSMPKQGIGSAFLFGCGFGSILGVLQALHLPIMFVTPAVWKGFYGLSKDKHASLHKGRLLYPTAELRLARHDGRAEALLIARFGVTHSAGKARIPRREAAL